MKMINKKLVLAVFIACLFSVSCTVNRNLVYFSDLPKNADYNEAITNNVMARIQKGDLLGITIATLNPEYNQLFSSGSLPPANNANSGTSTNTVVNNDLTREGFLVDNNGQVNLPVLGKVTLAALTKEEAIKKITEEVAKTAKEPIVNVRFLNYKVTVLGEVGKPGSIFVPNEQINVLEALGQAGDMTAYGLRDNVLIIREKDGKRTVKSINLNDKEVFNSPYFQLQQNDIVYVRPDNKEKNANNKSAITGPRIAIGAAIVSAITAIVVTIISTNSK